MSTTDNNYVEYDRDLMRSCIYGLAIGDALGVPYEFCARGTFECTGMVDGSAHGLICRLRTYCRQLRRRHRYDCGRGRCARRRVLRFRGNPAEVGRPAAWQGSNRSMHLGR